MAKAFQDVSTSCGDGLSPVESSRGAAAEDFDHDGDLDLIVVNAFARPTLIENATEQTEHWLQLNLRGRKTNRDAIGARVTVEAAGKRVTREVHSGRGYQSSFGQRLHFGIGTAQQVSRVTIRWPDGNEQTLTDVAVDATHTVIQP